MPHATRGGRGTANSRDYFRVTAKGVYGGAGGVEGEPLSPHAPRRAGDQLPAPGSSRKPRKKKEGKKKNCSPGSSRNAQKDTRLIRQGISTLKKEKREAAHSAASPPAAAFRAGNRLAPARNLG